MLKKLAFIGGAVVMADASVHALAISQVVAAIMAGGLFIMGLFVLVVVFGGSKPAHSDSSTT